MFASFNPIGIYLKNWFKEAFHLGYLLVIFSMLAIILYANYFITPVHQLIQTNIINSSFWASYLMYFFPFTIAYLLQPFFFKAINRNQWKTIGILVVIAPAIFAFRVNAAASTSWLSDFFEADILLANTYIYKWILKACLVILIVLAWAYFSKNLRLFYFDRLSKLKPYWLMLLLMTPLIIWAGLQPSFHLIYPRLHVLYNLALPFKYLYYTVFELSYAFDFISIEFFFRGFLIFTVMRFCGLQCVIPAACFYCCIHLDKPLAEAISSFLGGTLLAILSYHTKNVWGGIIVHMGIALLMEIMGILVK